MKNIFLLLSLSILLFGCKKEVQGVSFCNCHVVGAGAENGSVVKYFFLIDCTNSIPHGKLTKVYIPEWKASITKIGEITSLNCF